MSASLRYRLIGLVAVLAGLVWFLLGPVASEGSSVWAAFFAGAILGAGGGLLVTGEVFWKRSDWWPGSPEQHQF